MRQQLARSFGPLSLAAGVGLGAIGAVLLLTSPSASIKAVGFAAFAVFTFLLMTHQVRWSLLTALFFLAPVDISKAVIVPLTNRYHPVGPYLSPGLYITLAHVALLALLFVWLGRRVLLERRRPPMTGLDGLALAYAAWIMLSSMTAAQGLLSVSSAIAYTLSVLGFYVASHAIESRSDMRWVIRASLLIMAIVFVWVMLQTATSSILALPGMKGEAFGASVDFGGGSKVHRPSGFTSHPNTLAHYLVIMIPPAFAVALLGRHRIAARVWWIAVAACVAGGAMLLLTLSRGGWASLALAVSVVVFVYMYRGLVTLRQFGLASIVGTVAAIALLAADQNILLRLTAPDNRSLESRELLADMAFTIIKDNPLFGVGFGDYNRAAYHYPAPLFANVSPEYQQSLHQLVVHNHFLLVAAEVGIPACLFFIFLLWRFIRLPFPLDRWRDPGSFAIAVGLAAAVVGQALFFNSDNYYTDIRVFQFWLSVGVLQALTLQAEREGSA